MNFKRTRKSVKKYRYTTYLIDKMHFFNFLNNLNLTIYNY
jgi:hypothetical protein